MVYEITAKNQFIEEIVGRKLVQDDSWVIISPDGKVNGRSAEKGNIEGDWNWDNGFFCREVSINDMPLSRDCQLVKSDGEFVTFIHEKGSGISISWRIE